LIMIKKAKELSCSHITAQYIPVSNSNTYPQCYFRSTPMSYPTMVMNLIIRNV